MRSSFVRKGKGGGMKKIINQRCAQKRKKRGARKAKRSRRKGKRESAHPYTLIRGKKGKKA